MVALMKPDNRIVDTIIHGDALEVLRTLDACSVDACVVDPPYGLGEVKDIAGLLQAWIRDEDDSCYLGKSGFMGKEWDAGVPGPRYWREVLRVMKPGAHILCFASTRTVDLMMIALRLAGFQCRDTLMWVYGSGFPKSTDISKKIDRMKGAERKVIGKRTNGNRGGGAKTFDDDSFVWPKEFDITAPSTPEAQRYAGTGTALKPAHEPIILARKPLSEKSIAENCLRWGTGGLNIDQCRVGLEGIEHHKTAGSGAIGTQNGIYNSSNEPINRKQIARAEQGLNPRYDPQGRFPSNLLLSHSLFCTPLGTCKVKGSHSVGNPKPHQSKDGFNRGGLGTLSFDYVGEDGLEEVQAWECDPSCPVYQLDLQSGIRKSGLMKPGQQRNASLGKGGYHGDFPDIATQQGTYGDQGGASRYFSQFHPTPDDYAPFYYCGKSSRRERNLGLGDMPEQASSRYGKMLGTPEHGTKHDTPEQNNHPTVKSLSLMRYLVRLCTPPGGTVLDCFAGSGSTCVAAIHERLHFIAIEQDASYCEIARARVAHAFGEVTP